MTASQTPAPSLVLLRLRVTCLSRGLQWSGLPGSLLHGMLGKVLREQDPATYADLVGPLDAAGGNETPRPMWLQPPLDPRAVLAPGDGFAFDLLLANPRPTWLAALQRAIPEIGRQGLGKTRGRFDVVDIVPVAWRPGSASGPIALADMLVQVPAASGGATQFGLQCVTPLRLKAEGGLLRQAPSAALLVRRLLARAAMLAQCPIGALPLADAALAQAQSVQLTEQDLHWDDLTRYSARQDAVLPLGGLTGWIGYRAAPGANVAAALAWLAAGEWLHIGGKTTFGLGMYRMVPPRSG